MKRQIMLAGCTSLLLISALQADDWPQFRGPSSAVAAAKLTLPDTWARDKNILWQADLPGKGWSSPVVWKDRVFLTTVLNDNTPKPKPGLYVGDLLGKTPPGEHRWQVICLDLGSGKILWQRDAKKGDAASPIHIKNTYASETPVTDGERVYAYFGNHGVFCYDLSGKELWSKDIGTYKTRMGWGTGASPVLAKGRLIIVNDNEEKSFLLALDAKTGKELWKVERDEKSNWATPFIWENSLRTEIITPGSGKVRSYDLDGKLLWEFAGMSVISIPTPSADADLLFVSSGYILDARRPVYAIKPGAKGDITLKKDQNSNDFIIWCQKTAGPYHPSPLVYDEMVYVLLDKGFFSCFDAKTGAKVYDKQRIDPGHDKFTASPVAANGKIYLVSEEGDTFVIRAGAKYEVLAKNSLDDMTLATPALVRNSMLLRTVSKLYRIGTPRADDARKQLFKQEDKLTKDEPFDNVFKKSFQKVHSVKLSAEQLVRIEVQSTGFNAHVRLETADGKVVAKAEKGTSSHVVVKTQAAGDYRFVVTSSQPDKTGDYVLTVLEGILVDRREGLSERAPKILTMSGAARIEYIAELRGYLTQRGDKIDLEDAILTQLACKTLERISNDLAAVIFAEFMDLLAKTTDKKAQERMQVMENSSRRLRLLGKQFTFTGTTVDGKDFDLAKYKGKVVLIDFWATWCGPCRAEMPNLAKNYEKYKDQGFEVVGISLDADRAALEKFLEKEGLPWLCLHDKEAKASNPTARQVGVTAIPTCILIDRDGKVVSLQARGPNLGYLLEKHIGAK